MFDTAEVNPARWTREERQVFLDRGFRARRPGETTCSFLVRPDDYEHDLKRGEIEFSPAWLNYAFHSVSIPDGSVVIGMNFAQSYPRTAAITGKNLHFIECNLVNCELDTSWVIEKCNTAQVWFTTVVENGKEVQNTEYICDHPSKFVAQEAPATETTAVLEIARAREVAEFAAVTGA